jgi:serpin B
MIEQEVVASSNDFAFHLFAEVNRATPKANLFISPFSVSMALGMTLNGAADSTLKAIQHTLGQNDLVPIEINKGYNELSTLLKSIDKKVNYSNSSALWYRQNLQANSLFKDISAAYYEAWVEGIDFENPKSATWVNKWVENQTDSKVKVMVEEIQPENQMFFTNTVYFKADWAQAFDKSLTAKAPFYKTDGTSVQANMMFADDAEVLFYQDVEKTMIDLPYGNKQYSMVILLPREGYSMDDLIEGLDAETLQSYFASADTLMLDLRLPKFNIASKLELEPVLTALGMGVAFGEKANFSNLFENKAHVPIQQMIHHAYVEVHEDGTEAGASTISGSVSSTSLPTISVDQPFLFFIREKHTQAILFAGKMINPVM